MSVVRSKKYKRKKNIYIYVRRPTNDDTKNCSREYTTTKWHFKCRIHTFIDEYNTLVQLPILMKQSGRAHKNKKKFIPKERNTTMRNKKNKASFQRSGIGAEKIPGYETTRKNNNFFILKFFCSSFLIYTI